MTAAEQLIERGREQGREQGREAERRAILLKMLRARFGVVPRSAAARIQAADPAQLEHWLDRVVTAPTLAEVLAGA